MAIFEKDPVLNRIPAERNKAYGYGSIEGLFNEGLTKTIDQLISERLGVAEDPGKRWRTNDGGMHILSAASYGLMKADGFARSGGDLVKWVARNSASGASDPPRLHAAVGQVLGYPADNLWPPPGEPSATS